MSPLILKASPWSVWELGRAAAPSGYLACGETPGHKGGKHRSTTTSSLSRPSLTATTDPGGEFLFPEQKQATIPPETQPKKAAAGVLQLISNE